MFKFMMLGGFHLNEIEETQTYYQIYKNLADLSDQEIIEQWKCYQRAYKHKGDANNIGFEACEDILRQRGNTYIDENFLL